MKKKSLVKAKRTVYSYSVLRETSWYALKAAKENKTGSFFNCMIAMLFSALCIEAYFNHLGETLLTYWDTIEKKLSPEDKLKVITTTLEFQLDKGSRPFQTFTEIFKFRNSVAHAKTEYLKQEFEQTIVIKENPKLPLTEWEEKIDINNAERFVEDTKEIITQLHKATKFDKDPFWTSWIAEWEIK